MANRVLEVVRAKPDALRSEFEGADFARIGVVTKADFREILHRHVMRVSDPQVRTSALRTSGFLCKQNLHTSLRFFLLYCCLFVSSSVLLITASVSAAQKQVVSRMVVGQPR